MLFMISAALFGFNLPSSEITSARCGVQPGQGERYGLDGVILAREHRRYRDGIGAGDGLRNFLDVLWNLDLLERRLEL